MLVVGVRILQKVSNIYFLTAPIMCHRKILKSRLYFQTDRITSISQQGLSMKALCQYRKLRF